MVKWTPTAIIVLGSFVLTIGSILGMSFGTFGRPDPLSPLGLIVVAIGLFLIFYGVYKFIKRN